MFEKQKYHNPNEYTQIGVLAIPPGDHRVKITNVVEKTYGKTGLVGFEITLRVSRQHGLLWYRLTLDPKNEKKSNKKLTNFFSSFHITDYDLAHYEKWIGKQGAVRVMHSTNEETGFVTAIVYCCLSGWQRDTLPPFKDITKNAVMELNRNLLVKHLNQLCKYGRDINEYCTLITELKYRNVEEKGYCFISDYNAEYIGRLRREVHYDYEKYIDNIIGLIDKNHIIARKLALILLENDYYYTLQCADREFQGEVTICGFESIEEYIELE